MAAFRAPGRVNLIGGQVDYHEGWVVSMAIDREVRIAASPRADACVIARSREYDGEVSVPGVHGPAWGHSGIMPGYLSMLVHYRESGLTVALQFNTDDGRKVGNLKRTIDDVAGILRPAPAPAAPRDR